MKDPRVLTLIGGGAVELPKQFVCLIGGIMAKVALSFTLAPSSVTR